MIFHRNLFNEDIRKITIILDEIENNPIQKFNAEETRKSIESLEKHSSLCDEIKKVKDFLLFKKIFENAQGKDQAARFYDANKKLKELKELFAQKPSDIEVIFNQKNYIDTFKDIKEELGKKSENKSKEFIDQMIDYFNIKDNDKDKDKDKNKNKKIIEDLKLIINSKKYERIVKSIKFFFDNFLDKKLTLPSSINLSEMSLENLKKTLKQLKRNGIFDYESNSQCYRVFTSIYEKKEAIDFLISKRNTDIKKFENELKDKLDPTNRSISIKDIDDTIECLNQFKVLVEKDTSSILKYIQLLDEEKIKKFESFSKKYGSIIELNNKKGEDNFKEVYNIIQDASLLFNLDGEDFCYKLNGETIKINNIEELIKLKNKINIQPQKKIQENGDKKEEKKEKDIFELKCDKLIFFKDLISNLEIIYDKINILRTKGFNIPILINIAIKYPVISYKLNNKEKEFNKIKDYLFKVKNDYENQLSIIYENDKYLRLLSPRLFRKVNQHQRGNCEIYEMIRYILNKTNIVNKYNGDNIQDADNLHNATLGKDYEDEYKEYTKKIFDGISKYLIDLFKKNNLNFQRHYENMLIKSEKIIKGISIIKCKKISMEEYILYLFMKKLDKLPIAQNILICSNETSIEEVQSFLYKAILCEFNTLFAVEILESFSNFQHNKMYSYIDKLLSIKLQKYKKENRNKNDIDKSKSRDYLDSYIVFVYKNLENENAFKNELEKYTRKREENSKIEGNIRERFFIRKESQEINIDKEKEKNLDNLNISKISKNDSIQDDDDSKNKIIISQDFDTTKNIKVISSDVCGLGKSFKIKKEIENEKKTYYHFPLGGKLTKSVIYQKIIDLFKKIKSDSKKESKDKKNKSQNHEEYSEFNNVAIHLDIIETKETSLINEFLFSFLITKFYTNNENIIYIPNNIKIYIEVPNSFENYLTKFGILNAFNLENIIFGESKQNETDVPMLPLELEENIRKQFERLNGFKNDKEIEKFIKDTFNSTGVKEYSYHQVQTFIKLYINQFDSFTGTLKFTNSKGEDITKKCIEYFSNSTKYFTNGGFAKLIMEKKHIKDIFELCLDAYENDLSKAKLDTPLLFIDKKSMKCKFERLPDISEEENKDIKNKVLNKDVDIVFLIDATGSMGGEIAAAKDNVLKIFEELTKKYKDYKYSFRFGSVFYRDKIDEKSDKDEYFQFTNNIKDLEKNIGTVKAYGGGDGPEDWVGGYDIALNKMDWSKNGIKLIIHIADAGAHGTEFSRGDKHPEQGELLYPKIEECVKRNINIIGFKITSYPKQSFEKISEIYNNYKMYKMSTDNGQFIEIYDFVRVENNLSKSYFRKF